jgi:hypothetical protein
LDGKDEPGWHVVGVRVPAAGDPADSEFLVVKGDRVQWLKAGHLEFANGTQPTHA